MHLQQEYLLQIWHTIRKWITLVKHCEYLLTLPLKRLLNLLGGDWKFGGVDTLAAVDWEDLRESEDIYMSSIFLFFFCSQGFIGKTWPACPLRHGNHWCRGLQFPDKKLPEISGCRGTTMYGYEYCLAAYLWHSRSGWNVFWRNFQEYLLVDCQTP